MKRGRSLHGALAAVVLLACGTAEEHPARGIVRDVQPEYGQVVIDHEEIVGLMSAMTMNFYVPDPELLARLEKGQEIDFTVRFDGRSYQVVAATTIAVGSAPPVARLLAARDPAPAFDLIDQDGERVLLDDLSGSALVLSFVYTQCPGPCPILTGLHVSIERALPAQIAPRVRFVAVSLDPERDTPERLRAYANRHGAESPRWVLLTGPVERIDTLAREFGVGRARAEDGEIEHTVATFLIDPEGRIAERYLGLELEPDTVLHDLRGLL